MSIDEQHFLSVIRHGLASCEASRLAEDITSQWRPDQVAALLESRNVDVRRAAALALGMVGDRSLVGALARRLHDEDEQVHEMAEHALWSIWFRVCDCAAAEPFTKGSGLLADERYDEAAACFTQTIMRCPDFAEAYNQRGIAHFFAGRYEESAQDYRRTLEHMPSHFGAAAGLGHSLCHLDDMAGALEAYRRALAINPRMPGISSAIKRIEAKMAQPVREAKAPVGERYRRN